MSDQPSPSEYLPGAYLDGFVKKYNRYQDRYAERPRESDKRLIDLMSEGFGELQKRKSALSVLDIGCSTGNLLYYLRKSFPDLALTGGDLAASSIDLCRANPKLDGIQFDTMDLFSLPVRRYDVVIANAVAVYFDHQQYERAMASVAGALVDGGRYFAFEWLHPYDQDLHIVEKSASHPEGLNIYFRPYSIVRRILEKCGFSDVCFSPFAIPIDLEKGQIHTENLDGEEALNSYTEKKETGERMLFRGTLSQPWCHLSAVKAG